jgi:hypothetical protein
MPQNESSSEKSQRQSRPWNITVLSIFVLIISLFHLLKLIQVITQWEMLPSLPITVSPFYLAADGFVWGISGLILFWGLWTGQTWAGKAVLVLALLFAGAFWIDLIWVSEPEQLQTRWLINLVFTALGLAAVFLSLNLTISRIFFSGNPAKN